MFMKTLYHIARALCNGVLLCLYAAGFFFQEFEQRPEQRTGLYLNENRLPLGADPHF